MPLMPSTRYGRFLFYRSRALRRRHRAWQRTARSGPGVLNRRFGATRRAIDLSPYGKQAIRVYPKKRRKLGVATGGFVFWNVKPARGVWGVKRTIRTNPAHWGPNTHHRLSREGYFSRRVLSLPRLRHLQYKAYAGAVAEVHPRELYPFQWYPSGQANPNWGLLLATGYAKFPV